MNFIGNTFKYGTKNFFKLFALVLPASLLIGLLNPYRVISFLTNYKSMPIDSYFDMLSGFLSYQWFDYLLGLVAIILLVFTLSVSFSGVEYHMKSGKFSYAQAFKRQSNYIYPIISLLSIYIAFMAISAFLQPALGYLAHVAISGNGSVPTKITYFIVVSIYFVGHLICYMFGALLLLALNMLALNGHTFKSGISATLGLIEGRFLKFFLALVVPFALVVPVVVLTCNYSFYPAISVVLFLIQLLYTISLTMSSYFSLSGVARKDLRDNTYFKG